MSELKLWSTAVCMAALGCTAVRLLAPKKGSGQLFRLLTASFFLCSLLLPLFTLYEIPSLKTQLLPQMVVDDALESRVLEQLKEQVVCAVTDRVKDSLSERRIVARKTIVETDISEDGCIRIKQVTVYVDKQHTAIASTIQGVLEQEIGSHVNMVIKE